MAQITLNSTGVASSGALSLQSNGTTEAIGISTGQVATLAQNPILTSGTSNGVAYLNGSKVVTTGTALVFDGTNLGLGVTPSAWGSGNTALQIGNGALWKSGSRSVDFIANGYYNGTSYIYNTSNAATYYREFDGQHQWYRSTDATPTAGNAISFTQAMTLDASGNLGVGVTSPSTRLDLDSTVSRVIDINSTNASGSGIRFKNSSTVNGYVGSAKYIVSGGALADFGIDVSGANNLIFGTNDTERARIDSNGNLLVGHNTTGGQHLIAGRTATDGTLFLQLMGTTAAQCAYFYYVNSGDPNAANTAMKVWQNTTTSRSINAKGTINASGADYAEYMTKASDFNAAKGDVVGVDANGKLTNVFADAISFVVKSTNPSYVGGDTWGDEEAIGKQPDENATQSEKDAFNAALEAARQTVDRIAFAGQVPVNVIGATAGQYIVPVNDNGTIKGQAVSNPTFEQYQQSVGKVIAIEQDGRARIIVKVA